MAEKKKLEYKHIPIIYPDGEVKDTEPRDLRDALFLGGKIAQPMGNEDGHRYWEPVEDAEELINQGFYILQPDGTEYPEGQRPEIVGHNQAGKPIWGTAGAPDKRGFAGSAWDAVKQAAEGVGSYLNPARSEYEHQQGLNKPYDYVSYLLERLVEPQMQEADKMAQAQKEGQPNLEVARRALGAVIPMLGPWINTAADRAAQQIAQGDKPGALGTLLGNAAVGAASEVAPEVARGAGEFARGVGRGINAPAEVLDTPVAPGDLTPRERYRAAQDMGVNLDRAQATNAPVPATVKKITEHGLFGSSRFGKNNAANIEALHAHANGLLDDTAPHMTREEFGNQARRALKEHRDMLADVPAQKVSAQGLLDSIDRRNMGREEFGDAVREALERHRDGIMDRETQIYEDLDKRIGDKAPNLKDIQQKAQAIYDANKRFYDNHPDMLKGGDARVWSLVRDLARKGDDAPVDTWADLQRARSHLLDLTRGPEFVGDLAAGWAKQLTGAIDDTMTSAQNLPGLRPEDVRDFRAANSLHRRLKETYDDPQSPFYWVSRADDGLKVADKLNSLGPADQRTFREAMVESGNKGLIKQGQRQAVSRLFDPAGNGDFDLEGLPARWAKAPKEQVGGLLDLGHMNRIDAIANRATQATPYDAAGSRLAQVIKAPDGLSASRAMFTDSGALRLTPDEVQMMEQANPDLIPQLKRQAISRLFDPADNGAPDLGNFASRWTRAQKEPLRGVLDDDQMKNLNDLASVSRTVNFKSNPSGTAVASIPTGEASAATAGAVGALLGHPAGLVAAAPVAADFIASRRMTNPAATASIMEGARPSAGEAVAGPVLSRVLNPSDNAAAAAVAANQNNREGISTPPNGGQVMDVTKAEPNEVHDEAAAQRQLAAGLPGGQNPPETPAAAPSAGGVSKLMDPSGKEVYNAAAPEGATHEVIHPDGQTVLGHVVNGEYVPLAQNQGGQ